MSRFGRKRSFSATFVPMSAFAFCYPESCLTEIGPVPDLALSLNERQVSGSR